MAYLTEWGYKLLIISRINFRIIKLKNMQKFSNIYLKRAAYYYKKYV